MSIAYHDDILERFQHTLREDSVHLIRNWELSWRYQDKRTRRGIRYPEDQVDEFYTYSGPGDLLAWFNWLKVTQYKDYFRDKKIDTLTGMSRAFDQAILNTYHLEFDMAQYDTCIGRVNAIDYYIANLYPHPADSSPQVVLDFGPGYGRQANLWLQAEPATIYVGVDAIPKSYCLQHLYYTHSNQLQYDDVLGDRSNVPAFSSPGIYHIPTWRMDMLPDQMFDKIVVVHVLPELGATLVKELVRRFHRLLKPDGMIYIRDRDTAWRPGHRLNIDRILRESGFTLEYRAHIVDGRDLNGIPRIWRKTNPLIESGQGIPLRQWIVETYVNLDAALKGSLHAFLKSLRK